MERLGFCRGRELRGGSRRLTLVLKVAAGATLYCYWVSKMASEYFEYDGKSYQCSMGSDVRRDGMFVEVGEGPDGLNTLIHIFYSDVTHRMTATLFKPSIPLEVVEWAASVARKRLPISNDPNN